MAFKMATIKEIRLRLYCITIILLSALRVKDAILHMLMRLGHKYIVYSQYLGLGHSGIVLRWKNERILQLNSIALYTE